MPWPGESPCRIGRSGQNIRFTALSREESSRRCLTCHEFGEEHANFLRSQHLKNNVGCIDCHSVHHSKVERFSADLRGNIRKFELGDIYRNSKLFVQLRDSGKLEGKCKVCEFREICGGSRARAYAVSNNSFARDPSCSYEPRQLARE